MNADWRYAAHIPGALVCARAPVAGSGEWFYTYDVTFASAPLDLFTYTVTDGADRTAQGLSISHARFDFARRPDSYDNDRILVAHYHRNHWIVVRNGGLACTFQAGGIQGRLVFQVSGGYVARDSSCRGVQRFEPPIVRGTRAALP